LGKLLGGAGLPPPYPAPADGISGNGSAGGGGGGGSAAQQRQQELSGVWEVLTLDEDGRPFLDRRGLQYGPPAGALHCRRQPSWGHMH
jgi:hypothetical protein